MKSAKFLSLLIVSLFVFGLGGCGGGGKSASLTPADSTDEPREGRDRELFEEALKELQKKRYEQGRLLINTMITTYGDSPFLPMAKLTIADSYYREGGSTSLLQAEAEYKDWLQFFPNHELAPDVMIKMAEIHMRQVQTPDRDKDHAYQAERQLLELERRFPQTKENTRVQEYKELVQELLAGHDLRVAKFYFERRDAWKAAESRCLDIVTKYPKFSDLDTALWYLGRSLEEEENTEEAAKYFARVVREFPNSKFRDSAAERLERFGKPVPDPDPTAEERVVEHKSMMTRMMGNLFGPSLDVSKEGILLKEGDKIDESTYQLILNSSASAAASPTSTRTGVGAKAVPAAATSTNGDPEKGSAAEPKIKEKKDKKDKKKKDKKDKKSESSDAVTEPGK